MLLLIFAAVFFAALAVIYPLYLGPFFTVLGLFRNVEQVGPRDCKTLPALQACEKMILHRPSETLYLACSTPESRAHWTPSLNQLNATGRSENDFIATLDSTGSKIQRLELEKFPHARGLSVHGMDVVPSSTDPKTLFVYLVNHRAPLDGQDPAKVGADSSIEIFQTTVGSRKLKHLSTVEDGIILTPNDIVGSADGKSFHFTNDHSNKIGFARTYHNFFTSTTSVGFCHVDEGCKLAIDSLPGCNGIAKAPNNTFYVGSVATGSLRVLELQEDNSLVVTDVIQNEYGLDNLFVDDSGSVWAAAFPKMLLTAQHMKDGKTKSPTAVIKFSLNMGAGSFYGQKYNVEKVFEDDGALASGTTSVAYDVKRSKLFLHGLASPWLTICDL